MRASLGTLRDGALQGLGKLGWPELGALILIAPAAFAYHRIVDSPRSGSGAEGAEAFFFSPAATSPGLILGLAIWLIFRRRGRLSDAMLSPSSPISGGLSLVIMGAASLLCVWAHYVEALELMIPSMSMMLWGASLWLGSWSGASAMLAPCLFLLLAFPPPAVLLNSGIYPLQLMTASNTTSLLQLAGFSASHLGELVFRAENTFYVIESCAGVRSTSTLIMAAAMYNELMSHPRVRALCVLLISPVIGIVVNHLRVLWITLFPSSDLADVHTHQGIIMLVVGVVLIALGVTTSTLPVWSGKRVGTTSVSAVSPKLDGQWRADGLPLDQQFLGSVRFSEWMNRKYSKAGVEVDIFVGSNNRLAPRESFISHKNGQLIASRIRHPEGED
jgi:exosortase